MEFTDAELAIVREMVEKRTEAFDKPPWMPSHRATAIRLEARRQIATLPPAPRSEGANRVHYEAARRVVAYHKGGRPYAYHEADADGLPICAMRNLFSEREREWTEEGLLERLGPGPVTCGHCANAAAR